MTKAARITKIKALARDPNMRQIFVDGKVAVVLRASDVALLDVKEGDAWTAANQKRADHMQAAVKARRDSMRLLGRRAYSKGELVDRLVRKGHASNVALQVVSELAADRWIDDEEYGLEVARALVRQRPASQELVRSRLIARNLDAALADQIASTVIRGGGGSDAVDLAQQTFSRMKGVPTVRAARRVAGALARRGYDEETIADALERIGLRSDGDGPDDANS